MEEVAEDYKPRAHVSFAPTDPFKNAFPKEASSQAKRYATPTWAVNKKEFELEEAAKEEEEVEVPNGVAKVVQATLTVAESAPIDYVAVGLGFAVILGAGYLIYLWVSSVPEPNPLL